MSQLYPGDITPPPPPDNNPPTANAGADQVIEVSTMLYGTGIDPEGKPVTFKWEQTSGVPAVITDPAAASTKVTVLSQGENVFKLTVTDEKGSSASDEVKVSVR
jgi:predicted Zn-dependent protease